MSPQSVVIFLLFFENLIMISPLALMFILHLRAETAFYLSILSQIVFIYL